MSRMKRLAVLFLITIFAVNSVVLAANANACKRESTQAQVSADAGMPDCHKPQKQEQKENNTPHCEGVCFCGHIAAATHIMALEELETAHYPILKDNPQPFAQKSLQIRNPAPPFKPPIMIS